MIFNARQEFIRFEKRKADKKRIDIFDAAGERRFRFYDYGDKNYLQLCYADTFTVANGYAVKVYEIGESCKR